MQLVGRFQDKNHEIRELASRAILKVAGTEMGRVIFVSNNLIEVTATLFFDDVKKIRENAYRTLLNLSEFTFGCQAVIDADILRVLVDKLIAEPEAEILVLILELMN